MSVKEHGADQVARDRDVLIGLSEPLHANPETVFRAMLGSGPFWLGTFSEYDALPEVVPAIHPYIGINSLPALNHQAEFAAHCVGAEAERALADAATALAWTALDIALDRPTGASGRNQ